MTLQVRKAALATALGATLATAAQAVDWTEAPTFGAVKLNTGFMPDPYILTLTAGGGTAASLAYPGCSGYIGNAPDVDLNYAAGSSQLSIYVQSAADTTLAIYDADGNWHCSDDFDGGNAGVNPGVTLTNPSSGNYKIWIGTYVVGELPPAVLKISELQPSWDTAGDSGALQRRDDIEWGDNTSQWANDGECDDPRFAGPGMAVSNNLGDRYHDANDCRLLYQQGAIYLRP